MRLKDYKGENIIELIGEIAEPIGELFGDEDIRNVLYPNDKKGKRNIAKVVTLACKKHKSEVVQILAAINGQTVEEYQPTFTEFIRQAFLLFTDLNADVITVFSSSEQMAESTLSGAASESTTEQKA